MKTTLTTIILSSVLLINTGCVPSLTQNVGLSPNAENNATEEPGYIESKISTIFKVLDNAINKKIEKQNIENDAKEKKFDLDIEKHIEEKIEKI